MNESILLVTQAYTPDSAAIARLMADVGTSLSLRGNRVTVLTADRGYDNPTVRYPSSVTPDGVVIFRLPLSSFGKGSILLRALAGVSFTVQAAFHGLRIRKLDSVVVSTAPPMGALAGIVLGFLRGVRVVYWPMDLNPDQVLALGLADQNSIAVRLLAWLNRAILRQASSVVALDRFMARRLEAKLPIGDKMVIIPPWPEADDIEAIDHCRNPFRKEHNLSGKIVIMYSGTLGPSSPLDTVLAAAERFEKNTNLIFVFVGGGVGMAAVRERRRPNLLVLPYEPLERMRYSLAAGDVHIVSLGEEMVGIVHPCKVYGAMAAARPVLFLGPDESHVSDMMAEADFGWHVRHGDVDGVVRVINEILAATQQQLGMKGVRARAVIARTRTRHLLLDRVCNVIERATRSASNQSEHSVGRSAPT